MSDLRFAWDAAKAAVNWRKHGVSFEEAATVFEDPRGLLIADPDHSEDEDRYVLLGMSSRPRVVVVVHCYRENDAVIRIISARRADRDESRQYAKVKR